MKKIAAVLALVLLAAPAFAHDAKGEKGEKGKSCCAGASADKCPAKGEKKACADDKAKAEKPAEAKPSANKS
jgi:hypothetical protein